MHVTLRAVGKHFSGGQARKWQAGVLLPQQGVENEAESRVLKNEHKGGSVCCISLAL